MGNRRHGSGSKPRQNKSNKLKRDTEKFLEGIGVPDQQKEFKADPFQEEAVQSVVNGEDTLVIAPTGAGKTYIAIEAIKANIAMRSRSIYTTPLKALSNSKYKDFKKRFEPEAKVGILTGDRKIDTDADVVIATTEIYRNELFRDPADYKLVILDEAHYIADLQRGPVWEESILFSPRNSSLLLLSASISNYKEIAAWLTKVRKKECKIVIAEERPVELRLGFLHPDYGVVPLADQQNNIHPSVKEYYQNDSDNRQSHRRDRRR